MIETPASAVLALGLGGLLAELIGASVHNLLLRKICYGGAFILTAFSASLLLVAYPRVSSVVIALVAAYRLINHMRAVTGRMHESHGYAVTRRSSLVLITLQAASVGIWFLQEYVSWAAYTWAAGLLAVSLLAALLLSLVTVRNLRRSSIRPSDKYVPDAEMPTVSVCVPARNETVDLPSCLASILASDYPKLEILVLDDCSQDRTSEIIKGFAQDGVRFIAGEPPKKGWLAKNQAYQQLAEAASGDILLFCGVDARFDKSAIRHLVGSLRARKKQMISVLPKGLQALEHAGLVQPMRYWWELALPRRFFNRPPVLSTCWMIQKETFFALGGMKAVDNSVLPEGYFARELAKADAYSFMRAGKKLSVATAKKLDEQWSTAVRMRYPQLRKRPESVLLLFFAEVWLLAFPLSLFILGFFMQMGLIWLLAGLNVLLLAYIHFRIIQAWSLASYATPLATFPAAVLIELYLLHYSMWRYEFGNVEWKERNICIPVMHTYARLPKA